MTVIRTLGIASLVLVLGSPTMVRADDDAARVRSIVEPVVDALMSRYAIPGMAVAVTLQGRRTVMNFGVASRESGEPVTDATLFEIGSVSKTLTATLAAFAEVTGKLSLSDHVGRHVPELSGAAIDRATLLQLGTYTAGGLPLQFPDAVEGTDGALTYFRGWLPAAAPGSVRRYSNPSLGLFGLAAANALDADFSDAMHSIVFPAFGMSSTFIRVPEHAISKYAWGTRGDKAVRAAPGPLDQQTYGVKTTAADLLRFVEGNIDPSTLEEPMQRAVRLTHVAFFRAGPLMQGLGWEQYAWPTDLAQLSKGNSSTLIEGIVPATRIAVDDGIGPRLFDKTGSTGGFGAYVVFVPVERLGIVLLANRNYPIEARVNAAWAILSALRR